MRKIRIHADWRTFTVGQWMKATGNMGNPVGLVAALSNYSKEELSQLPKHVVDAAAEQARTVLQQKPTRIYKYVEIDGEKWEFIDHWENLTTAEYVDLEHFGKELHKTADKFLSVCFRPTESTWFGRRAIQYEGPVTAERMRKVPASVLAGTLVFFYIGRDSYYRTLSRSLAKVGQATLSPSIMGGTTSSTNSQENEPRTWKKWKNGPFAKR